MHINLKQWCSITRCARVLLRSITDCADVTWKIDLLVDML